MLTALLMLICEKIANGSIAFAIGTLFRNFFADGQHSNGTLSTLVCESARARRAGTSIEMLSNENFADAIKETQ